MSSKRRSGPAGDPDDFLATPGPDPKRRKRNDVSRSNIHPHPPSLTHLSLLHRLQPSPNCCDATTSRAVQLEFPNRLHAKRSECTAADTALASSLDFANVRTRRTPITQM